MTSATKTPPHLLYGLTEGARSFSELGWYLGARRWLKRHGSGDGRPILVIPGLNAADWSTKPSRSLLRSVGYEAYGWGLGCNIGPTERIIAGLDELLLDIRDRHDAPVSIIGQSLGGFLGRDLANRHPGAVDRLISIGGPMAITSLSQSRAGRSYRSHADEHLPEFSFEQWIKLPQPEIPATSIYSRMDGVVHWSACHYPEGPLTENIEVYSSHFGMGFHPAALYAMLDRLEAPLGQDWTRFAPPRHLACYFPARARAACTRAD